MSVDSCERERAVTELWDDVGLLDRGWTAAGAGSDELAGCVLHAAVDDSEAVVVVHIVCIFKTVDGLTNRFIRLVKV